MNFFTQIINFIRSIGKNEEKNGIPEDVKETNKNKGIEVEADKLKKEEKIDALTKKKIPDANKIKRDFSVTEKWHKGWARNLDEITELVVHGTGGGSSAAALMSWVKSGERKTQYVKGIALFQLIIDYNGTIYQISPLTRWFYHSTSGRHDQYTIGVEMMNPSPRNATPYKKEQYDSLFWLIFEYLPYHCKNFKKIVGHDYNGNRFSGIKKGCPGMGMEWKKLEAEFKKRKKKYTSFGFEAYEIVS